MNAGMVSSGTWTGRVVSGPRGGGGPWKPELAFEDKVGPWRRTPWWLRLVGKEPWRRTVTSTRAFVYGHTYWQYASPMDLLLS